MLLAENSNHTLKLECDMKFQCTKRLTGNVAVINAIRDERKSQRHSAPQLLAHRCRTIVANVRVGLLFIVN
jgi:hypothetical protein